VFEGPLDLLLHLIEEQRLDIYDIPIAHITSQYLAYLRAMERVDVELASEFLVMAATLMAIKARMLLPKPAEAVATADEEDPRRELVSRLLEYKKFKKAAAVLRALEERQRGKFPAQPRRPSDLRPDLSYLPADTLQVLWTAFSRLLKDADPVPQQIMRDLITVRQKMALVLRTLRRHPGRVQLDGLIGPAPSRTDIVVTFLAVLELARMGRLRVIQDFPFGPVWLERVGEWHGRSPAAGSSRSPAASHH